MMSKISGKCNFGALSLGPIPIRQSFSHSPPSLPIIMSCHQTTGHHTRWTRARQRHHYLVFIDDAKNHCTMELSLNRNTVYESKKTKYAMSLRQLLVLHSAYSDTFTTPKHPHPRGRGLT